MSRCFHSSRGHPIQSPVATIEQAMASEAHPEVGVAASPAVLMGSEVSMDETSDSLPRAILGYRRFPNARASGGSSPQTLIGERKRKLSGSGVQDDRFAKRANIDTSPNAQSGPSHEFVAPGMEITGANEATTELSKVEEDLRSALQEIEGLHAQIGMLRARDVKMKNHMLELQLMVYTSMRITNDLLADSE
ncbi:hypothetical protein EDB85DRAFT_1899222 [Lactarius pseudohatsudake]|nr:hypothetical protein EDB85DRAFT_1899222 [Lactarius pseudohatsudake]